jgi:hypothetical protein
VGLHTDYRSHSHGWLELDCLYRFGHWRGSVAGTDQPGVRPQIEINTADRCQDSMQSSLVNGRAYARYFRRDTEHMVPYCFYAMGPSFDADNKWMRDRGKAV